MHSIWIWICISHISILEIVVHFVICTKLLLRVKVQLCNVTEVNLQPAKKKKKLLSWTAFQSSFFFFRQCRSLSADVTARGMCNRRGNKAAHLQNEYTECAPEIIVILITENELSTISVITCPSVFKKSYFIFLF